MSLLENRFARQASLVPRELLSSLAITVVGVGAIGRQLSLQLTCLGATQIHLIDPDVVESTNITTQGYTLADVGKSKVEATQKAIQQIDCEVKVTCTADRFRPPLAGADALFCCVDSIAARGALWRSASRRCPFWADGRMLGEVMRVLIATEKTGRDHYPTTLFEQAHAQAGACTARSTVYTAAIAAGLMVHQFTRWLRGLPVDADQSLNLLAAELVIS
jgi:sulfur carrier protein ThiS adenylyltransferase